MTTRMKFLIGFTMVAVQCALIAVYFAVDAERSARLRTSSFADGPPRETQGHVSSYIVTRRDGTTYDLVGNDRPVLVHFWGTWCPPCRDELPELLEVSNEHFDVVAVALDDDWESIETFLGEGAPDRIVLGNTEAAREQFEVSTLPQTVLMMPDGTLTLRVSGARDWSDPTFVGTWESPGLAGGYLNLRRDEVPMK